MSMRNGKKISRTVCGCFSEPTIVIHKNYDWEREIRKLGKDFAVSKPQVQKIIESVNLGASGMETPARLYERARRMLIAAL